MSGGSSISQLDGSTLVLVMMMILAPDSFLLLPPLPPAAPPPPSSSSQAWCLYIYITHWYDRGTHVSYLCWAQRVHFHQNSKEWLLDIKLSETPLHWWPTLIIHLASDIALWVIVSCYVMMLGYVMMLCDAPAGSLASLQVYQVSRWEIQIENSCKIYWQFTITLTAAALWPEYKWYLMTRGYQSYRWCRIHLSSSPRISRIWTHICTMGIWLPTQASLHGSSKYIYY